jgi:hypothetical protein
VCRQAVAVSTQTRAKYWASVYLSLTCVRPSLVVVQAQTGLPCSCLACTALVPTI